jgi:hypothetical protein
MRWDTKYVDWNAELCFFGVRECVHAHTLTDSHAHNLLQPCHSCRHIWKCSSCMAVEPVITFCGMFLHVKTATFQPILGSQVESKTIRSETWRIWWLEDGWYLVIQWKLLYCKGDVTRHTVMDQNPIIFPLFQPCLPNGIPHMLQNFDKKWNSLPSYRDTFEVHQPRVIKDVISMTCSYFVTCWCHSEIWCFVSGL